MSRTGKRSYTSLSGLSTSALMKKARSYESAKARPRLAPAKVQRALRIEKKGVDTDLSSSGLAIAATTNTNANCFVLNLIQTGSGSWNRVGRKVSLQSVRVRGQAIYNYGDVAVTGNILGNCMRMVVVWDKQPSGGAIPAFDVVFGKTSQLGTESCTFVDPVRFDNMERFSVLRDTVIDMHPNFFNGAAGTTDLNSEVYTFDEYVPLGGRETVYSGQSNPLTIADISTGALYVYFRAIANTSDDSSVEIASTSFARLRYTDV